MSDGGDAVKKFLDILAMVAVAAVILAIVFVAILFFASDEEKLAYLWTIRDNGIEGIVGPPMEEVTVGDANCAVSLPAEFGETPERTEYEPFHGSDVDVCTHYTFRSPSDGARVDISYLRKAGGKSFLEANGVVGIVAFNNKVSMPVEFGIGPFVQILGEGINVLSRGKPKKNDWAFARKHDARGFSSCFALIQGQDRTYRVFQVTIVRESEAWRLQTYLPSAHGGNKARGDFADMLAAGEILGRFRILN